MNLMKKPVETLGDKLPYFGFDADTDAIWLKDGSVTLSLKIAPKDCSNLMDDDLEVLRFGLTPILGHLPEGSVFQALFLRERSKTECDEAYLRWTKTHTSQDSSRPDSNARQMLFDYRNAALDEQFSDGSCFQSRCYITLRVLPEVKPRVGKTLGGFSHLAFAFSGKKKQESKSRPDLLRDLSNGLETLRTGLEALGFEVSNVSHEERLKIIYEWLNPERARTMAPSPLTPSKTLSQQVALTDLLEKQDGLSLGRAKAWITSLKSLPEISIPGSMGAIASAQIPFWLFFTVYVLPQTEERDRLMRKQRLAQGMASGNAVRNLMAEAQLKDVEDTLSALISSGEKMLAASFQMAAISEDLR